MEMNRRNFMGLTLALVTSETVNQLIPLGRVWSFPKKIKVVKSLEGIRALDENYIAPILADDIFRFGWQHYYYTAPTFQKIHILNVAIPD